MIWGCRGVSAMVFPRELIRELHEVGPKYGLRTPGMPYQLLCNDVQREDG